MIEWIKLDAGEYESADHRYADTLCDNLAPFYEGEKALADLICEQPPIVKARRKRMSL